MCIVRVNCSFCADEVAENVTRKRTPGHQFIIISATFSTKSNVDVHVNVDVISVYAMYIMRSMIYPRGCHEDIDEAVICGTVGYIHY
jgi:hypothetical protein